MRFFQHFVWIILFMVLGACARTTTPPPADSQPAPSAVMGPMRFVPKQKGAKGETLPGQHFQEPATEGALPQASSPEALAAGPGRWSIVVAAFPANTGADVIARAVNEVRTRGGLPDAISEVRGKSIVIASGSYPSGSDPAAQRDLKRLREREIDGARPFEGAVLSPPPFEGLAGTRPEYDLSNARARFGKDALYTLQIAVYERMDAKEPTGEDLREIRLAAESAAVELRREGEQAFYYHGPRRSMVTVGIFGPKDYDPQQVGRECARLSLLRTKYPYNLVNGATYKTRARGQTRASEQPSFVVVIPAS